MSFPNEPNDEGQPEADVTTRLTVAEEVYRLADDGCPNCLDDE